MGGLEQIQISISLSPYSFSPLSFTACPVFYFLQWFKSFLCHLFVLIPRLHFSFSLFFHFTTQKSLCQSVSVKHCSVFSHRFYYWCSLTLCQPVAFFERLPVFLLSSDILFTSYTFPLFLHSCSFFLPILSSYYKSLSGPAAVCPGGPSAPKGEEAELRVGTLHPYSISRWADTHTHTHTYTPTHTSACTRKGRAWVNGMSSN